MYMYVLRKYQITMIIMDFVLFIGIMRDPVCTSCFSKFIVADLYPRVAVNTTLKECLSKEIIYHATGAAQPILFFGVDVCTTLVCTRT